MGKSAWLQPSRRMYCLSFACSLVSGYDVPPHAHVRRMTLRVPIFSLQPLSSPHDLVHIQYHLAILLCPKLLCSALHHPRIVFLEAKFVVGWRLGIARSCRNSRNA